VHQSTGRESGLACNRAHRYSREAFLLYCPVRGSQERFAAKAVVDLLRQFVFL
jgi:hypothetical protein